MSTKTGQTVLGYTARVEQLRKRIGKVVGSNSPTMYEIVAWLIGHQGHFSKATWRQYRAALMFCLENNGTDDAQNAIDLLRATDVNLCKPRGTSTSAKKLKRIPESDIDRLAGHFAGDPTHRYGIATLAWLLSGIWAGLRPSEWQSAQLLRNEAGDWVLNVKNAKNTNGRSHGESRVICLSNMDAGELDVISLHLHHVDNALAGDNGITFDTFYHSCRDCLYEANRKLWPQRTKFISLYSARHQFSADAKKNGLSKAAIAALMGHASEKTAGMHYGRRVSGRGGFRVTANLADVVRVEALNAHRLTENNSDRPKM